MGGGGGGPGNGKPSEKPRVNSMGKRRRARECALAILYGMDVSRQGPDVAIERFFGVFGTGDALDPGPSFEVGRLEPKWGPASDPEARAYTELLVHGVYGHKARLDEILSEVSRHWRLDRMARLDRNILRLGAFELTERSGDVPRKVAINEAIDVAKGGSGPWSPGAFVNGILDRIGKEP